MLALVSTVAVGAGVFAAPGAAASPRNGVWEAPAPDGFLRFTVLRGAISRVTVACLDSRSSRSATVGTVKVNADGTFRAEVGELWKLPNPFTGRFNTTVRAGGWLNLPVVSPLGYCGVGHRVAFTARRVLEPSVAKFGRWEGSTSTGLGLRFRLRPGGLIRHVEVKGTSKCVTRSSKFTGFAGDAVVRPTSGGWTARTVGDELAGEFSSATEVAGTYHEVRFVTATATICRVDEDWSANYVGP